MANCSRDGASVDTEQFSNAAETLSGKRSFLSTQSKLFNCLRGELESADTEYTLASTSSMCRSAKVKAIKYRMLGKAGKKLFQRAYLTHL